MIPAPFLAANSRRCRLRSVICALGLIALGLTSASWAGPASTSYPSARTPVVRWTQTAPFVLRDATPLVLGTPSRGDDALQFDGTQDALIFPTNPLESLAKFTIEILIRPDADGASEQRFFHLQDRAGRRVLMELRLDRETRSWSLDTYLHASTVNHLALLDRKKKHPAGKWSWVSLTYDGQMMRHYVNGLKDAEGRVRFPPMTTGEMSLGVRLNRVNWFKGAVREIRVFDTALAPEEIAAPLARATD